MSKMRNESDEDMDGIELFADPDMDLDSFVESMETKRDTARHSWKLVEELRDAKALREQLADWDDFDA